MISAEVIMPKTGSSDGIDEMQGDPDDTIDSGRKVALLKTGALQDAIFNSANFSSIATDAEGVIQIFNVGAERMLGYAAADVVNKITPADISDPQEVIARAEALSLELVTAIKPGFDALVFKASRGIEDIYELTYIRKDHSRFPAVVSVTALRDAREHIIGYLLIGTDNTARKQIEMERALLDQRLRDQQFYTRSLIESNIDALMTTDPQGIISDVNQQMLSLTGCTRDELIGAPCKNFFTDPERADAAIKQVLIDNELSNYELTVRAKNGKETVVSYNAATFHNRELKLQGVFAAARDVTERKQFENAIVAAKEEADVANRAKSTFLATMSHEIRTPMNAVIGMLELLSMGKLDSGQRATLEIVRTSGKTLLRIIDDILDFSKIEAGKLAVCPETASINEVIENVHSLFTGSASGKSLLLKHSVDPEISAAVLVDPIRLRQILNNLVSNALKFTPKGGTIEIKAELIQRAEGNDQVKFSVKDTGIGISEEQQRKLFKPFHQADNDTGRRYGGTGLGLTICQRLAEMMGGSIDLLSELGKGTAMTLILSLPIADPKDLPKTDRKDTRDLLDTTTRMRRMAPSVSEAETEGTLVLLVDDHPTNRLVLEQQLNALGYAAETAKNGVKALDHVKSGRFGMVITDCHMPEMDGYELTRSIRALESAQGGKRIPIIAYTANALDGEAEACLAAGMNDYLAKPIELKKLLKKLDQWLPIPAIRTSEKSSKDSVALVPIDRSVLSAISGGDATVERDILLDFRRVNDEDAIMLEQAVGISDTRQVAHLSHRIKGASKMVGAIDLASACKRIEHASRNNDWTTVVVSMKAFNLECIRLNAYFDVL